MPMMYMDDAIAATIQIMQRQQNKIRSSYNLAVSFTPTEAARSRNTFQNSITYEPDFQENS
jgi:hypothetical protein